MKVAFVGKGGSGKTTLSALFARHLAASARTVVAVDADINQHLAVALGMSEDQAFLLPALGEHLTEIKDYLRGYNPLISSAAAMVKTTPAGRGSRLLRPAGDDPIHQRFARPAGAVTLLATGAFTEDDLGVACYHSKVGAVELYLNHLVDQSGEYVIVDMTAGADSFASGLFTRFDLTFIVAEPTRKGVSVYRQYRDYAAEHAVPLAVVGNKITGPDDVDFLRHHIGDDLLVCLEHSPYVRAQEQGHHAPLDRLEEANRAALDRLHSAVDARPQDWQHFQAQAAAFHLKNAAAWANESTGEDLAQQIDPGFVHGPAALQALSSS
ncbi:ATP-binding protein [Kitasatospora sp. RB6PN24]|uniref:ATP-binding protein n=1 Tax=Kitasatospora humi TaxID=2893891 RepID=UPI001E45E9F4|nr:ATP-binding protein [Kitasatospora humi]MCC9311546.1 ATP-binding protein [Kitasatospora humi]